MDKQIFISYSHHDTKIARDLLRELENRGIYVWSDRDIKPGEDWGQEIEKALTEAKCYLILLSPDFVESQWNNVEMGVALSKQATSEETRIIPILIRECKLPFRLSSFKYLDAREENISELGEKISEIIEE